MSADNPQGYELSAEYLAGFVASAEKQGVVAKVPWSQGMQDVIASLPNVSWCAPLELERWGTQVLNELGPDAIEGIGYHLIIKGIGPIFKVTARLNKNAPGTVLKQFAVLCGDSIRGVGARFEADAPTAGSFIVTYPQRDPPLANALLWKGTLSRIASALEHTTLTGMTETGNVFRFAFSWSLPK